MATGRWAVVWSPFRHRNYRLFFAGQLVSLVGTWTQTVAQTWLVYRLTGSPIWLGAVTFCQQAPIFFLATLGGSIADRYRRRRILVLTQTSAMTLAFLLAGLTLGGVVRVTHILVLAVCLGVVNAVDIPTRQSFIVEMVGRDHLMSALALNSSMVNGARILGPAIAGLAIRAVGEGWCFLVNGFSFVAVIVGLLAMRNLPEAAAPSGRESVLARVLSCCASPHRAQAPRSTSASPAPAGAAVTRRCESAEWIKWCSMPACSPPSRRAPTRSAGAAMAPRAPASPSWFPQGWSPTWSSTMHRGVPHPMMRGPWTRRPVLAAAEAWRAASL